VSWTWHFGQRCHTVMTALLCGCRDLWNNPIVCNCSAAWLRTPTVCLPSLSVNDSPPIDRCFVDSPEDTTRFLSNVDFSDCGRLCELMDMFCLFLLGAWWKQVEADRISASVSVSAPNVDKWALSADIRFRPKAVVPHSVHFRFRRAAVGKFGGCRK